MQERNGFERELANLAMSENGTPGPEREHETPNPKSLPLILAGPIVRRATADKVWFWFASRAQVKNGRVEVYPYDARGGVRLDLVDPPFKAMKNVKSEFRSVRLGQNIWVVLASATAVAKKYPSDVPLGYDIEIDVEEGGKSWRTKLSKEVPEIAYKPFPLPTFLLGSLNRRLVHGSCRRPGADAQDAFFYYDQWLAEKISDPYKRPASLFLTGDQIYADDVAVPLFEAVRKIANDAFGYVEQVPTPVGTSVVSADSFSWKDKPDPFATLTKTYNVAKYGSARRRLSHRTTSPIGFTTDDGEAHLLSLPEYAAMYLATWSPELCTKYGVEESNAKSLRGFCRATKACRRVMANTATYMLCDDHDVTDDWNLDQEWEDKTKKNPLSRRIISNALAAYWAFQAWGNDPDAFEQRFFQVLTTYFDQLRSRGGDPRGTSATDYETLLLDRHWSYVAESNPKALCVDTRTRRETPARSLTPPSDVFSVAKWMVDIRGKTAILSGKRVWPFIGRLLLKMGFGKGDVMLLVLPTPFLPHRSMMYIQQKTYKFPQERYQGDYELYGNNPAQRAQLVLWFKQYFDPSSLVIFSGDVHHGSLVTGRYAYGASVDQIKRGNASWAMRIVQVTSSPIKNEKNVAYREKRWWTVWQTDAGNVGESVIPQWEHQYSGKHLAMHAAVQKLDGGLGRQTYIFEPHLCVVDMPSKRGGNVDVLFIGEKGGKVATATGTADTDNNPAKFKFTPFPVRGMALPPMK